MERKQKQFTNADGYDLENLDILNVNQITATESKKFDLIWKFCVDGTVFLEYYLVFALLSLPFIGTLLMWSLMQPMCTKSGNTRNSQLSIVFYYLPFCCLL